MPSAQTARAYLCSIFPNLTEEFLNHPTNPGHLAFLDLPVVRKLVFCPSGQDMRPREVTAILCYITGNELPKSCRRCQTKSGMFDRCVVAASEEDEPDPMAGQCSNCFINQCDQCVWDDGRHPTTENGSAECRLPTVNGHLSQSPPALHGKPRAATPVATENNDQSELQRGDHSDQVEISHGEESSDDEFIPADSNLTGKADTPIYQAPPQPLTEKVIPYNEVYQMARDPQAKYKHCKYFVLITLHSHLSNTYHSQSHFKR